MRSVILGLVILLALPSASTSAKSKRHKSRVIQRFGFQLRVPEGWKEIPGIRQQAILVLANNRTGQVALVSRVVGPNDLANISPAMLESLEAQVQAKTERYNRISGHRRVFGKRHRKRPGYDLWFRMRRDRKKAVMGVRFLFYPGYTLTLTIDSPGNKASAETRKLLKSFQPFFPR